MGAWIEISYLHDTRQIVLPSLPSWERGLKSFEVSEFPKSHLVAPFVGAWIEILMSICPAEKAIVAPFVGAWIEIDPFSDHQK